MSTERIKIIGGFPQSDWNVTDTSSPEYIKNKPEYFAVTLTQKEYDELLANGKVVATTQYFIYEEDGK